MNADKEASWKSTVRRRGFVFVHVPKTAGFAMTQILTDGIATEHMAASKMRELLGEDWERLFKFGFVRNPAPRALSAFWYLKGGGMNAGDASWSNEHLARFDTCASYLEAMANHQVAFPGYVHFRPQSEFLCAPDGAIMVDFVGRYEHIDRDFSFVADKVGCSPHLSSLNATHIIPEATDDWSDETWGALQDLYSLDFDRFGYAKR